MANTSDQKRQEALEEKLSEIRVHGTEDAYRAQAEKLGFPFSDLHTAPVSSSALALIPEDQAKKAQIAAIIRDGTELTVAVVDPENAETKAIIDTLTKRGFKVQILMTTPAGMAIVLKHYQNIKAPLTSGTGSLDIQAGELDALQSQITNVSDLKNQLTSVSITKLLEILLAGALKTGASDVHFEPEADKVRLRYRLDGVLSDITDIEPSSYTNVLNRIKVLSKLKLNVHQAPQDGRFTIHQKDIDIEVRVSILPSEYGETIVMRLLDPRLIKNKLEDLGMRPELLAAVKDQLQKPNGAILTTGPTGSGKTTTLYAFINFLNTTDTKIITIEDPIEYHIDGISQTQVEPTKGYSFANGLRAIVRQDPDIVLVGEIRDNETADIALNAALTGHLVLSTIHTNDAAGTVPRLIDLKVNPQIIAPAIHMAMAQRLVRKLCPKCKKEAAIPEADLKIIKETLEPLRGKIEVPETDKVWTPVGCQECNGSGYKGRIGVYEAFAITREMEALILSTPSISAIQDLAVQQGMVTMHQDAYLKLLEGVTSLDEIKRILG